MTMVSTWMLMSDLKTDATMLTYKTKNTRSCLLLFEIGHVIKFVRL